MNSERVAVVTGGSRGIGRGIVTELAVLGYSIVVNYRTDKEAASQACAEAIARGARRVLPIPADVSQAGDGQSLLDQVLSEFGKIDLWVNNAGVAPKVRKDLLESTQESWDHVLDTNLRGPFFLTQKVAQAMIQQRQSNTVTNPQIHFITSVSSAWASVNRPEYCVSKAGLSMVAQLFAVRLAQSGINVYEIRPGLIETDMTAGVHTSYQERIGNGLIPIHRWGTPTDVGRAVAALASGALPYSTGEIIYVDGGLHLKRL
jgi:NAD(P)-dependent dehydrogenase (short-subunit alcohol dehydrogenase family)